MKKTLLSLLAVACIAVASQMISCTSGTSSGTTSGTPPDTTYNAVRMDVLLKGKTARNYFRPNEIIVMFRKAPIAAEVNNLISKINGQYFDASTLERKKCKSCKGYVELWQAPNIHTRIHANGIAAGSKTPGGSQGVGEDGLGYYSLNFTQNIPMDSLEKFEDFDYSGLKKAKNDITGKDVVRIAVLDTGIDTERIISSGYRWTNKNEVSREARPGKDDDGNCYIDDKFGWNFIGNNNDVMDDNPNRHGTLVSHYIINGFANSQNKAVELMTLKTHDKDGYGDLFSSICAIHYAIEKKANIINASWGFYYYEKEPIPYLDSLITQVLRKEGILFVAAAGNKIDQNDNDASAAYLATNGVPIPPAYLRNLEYHNFYPALLSKKDNNVVTVTTANKERVSPTQNYSSKYVDLGAIPDDPMAMRFKVPFDLPAGTPGPVTTISGSSFAAAIVTGRIGAFLPISSYAPNIGKSVLLDPMEAASRSTRSPRLESHHKIRMGRITPRD